MNPPPKLDVNGFTMINYSLPEVNFEDENEIKDIYYKHALEIAK
jgi:hypothetical protein